jgi:hypothetical protein
LGKILGQFIELEEDENVIIESENFGEMHLEKKGLLGFTTIFDFNLGFEPSETDRVLILPYLTNKRIRLWCLYVTQKFGAISKWTELPFDFIEDVKFQKVGADWLGRGGKVEMKIVFRVPQMKAGLFRKVLGLGAGAEKFEMTLDVPNIAMWQMQMTKIMLDKRKVEEARGIAAASSPLLEERAQIRQRLTELEDKLLKGEISADLYEKLSVKYEQRLKEIDAQLAPKEEEKPLKALGRAVMSAISKPKAAPITVTATRIYCHQCGAENPADAAYCHKCGQKLKAS